MQFAAKVLARSVITTGTNTSNAGLTVAAAQVRTLSLLYPLQHFLPEPFPFSAMLPC